jgi:hypothetical protein
MKARGIVVIDYDFSVGTYVEAAEQQKKLEEAIAALCKDNDSVVGHQTDMRERRDRGPTQDIRKMKVRVM